MTEPPIDPIQVREELSAILASSEFDGATRLQEFLTYVVEEALQGRGADIRAKTIGENVYDVLSNQGDDPLVVVRVDAGRLRRKLKSYYDDAEHYGKVRIHVDVGGYAPRFELRHSLSEATQPHKFPFSIKKWRLFAFGAMACISVGIFAGFGLRQNSNGDADTDARETLFLTSPTKLQAKNLADEARDLMFPALDRKRLMAALALFEQVIDLDEDYYAGFAGAGQINAMLASQMPTSPARTAFLTSAKEQSLRAVNLAPTSPWAQSAMAMTHYADKNCAEASETSQRATKLSPDNLYTHNFDAIIALFCGNFEDAVDVAKPRIGKNELSDRLVFRNVTATAEFHRGNFRETIDLYTAAINSGDPVGALTLAYLAASYAELGDQKEAQRYAKLLQNTWPDFPLVNLINALYVQPQHAEAIITSLQKAGWQANAG